MSEHPALFVGCCGAYCKTCKAFRTDHCKGCKLGYKDGSRDIDRARCRIKLCSFRDRGFESCADCLDFASCKLLNDWYTRKGWRGKKYRAAAEFIRDNGYARFAEAAADWKDACGALS